MSIDIKIDKRIMKNIKAALSISIIAVVFHALWEIISNVLTMHFQQQNVFGHLPKQLKLR